ncbi:MAG TPA: DMP19 family protein [bacterium]|nr:DMP19 family protein [bacterium]
MFALVTAVMSLQSIAASYSAEGKDHVFKFDPPDWTAYTHEVTKVKEKDMGDPGVHKDAGKAEAVVFIRKTDDGYTVRHHIRELSLERNGRKVDNPVFDVMKGLDVWMYLDADGKLLSIEGYESMFDIIKEKFPPEVGRRLSALIDVELLTQKEKTEWDGRIGSFVGIGFNVGDILLASDNFNMPPARQVKYYTGIEFSEMEACEDKECVRIRFKYNTDAGNLASFLNMKLDEFKDPADEIPEASGIEISGEGSRLIDPDTMLIYSETISRDIKTEMIIPGSGAVETRIKETEEHRFDYERGKSRFTSLVSDAVFKKLDGMNVEDLEEPDRVFVCVWVTDGEVNKGGFGQFYFNSSGELAVEATAAYEAIGAAGMADIIRRANSVFPDGRPPKDRDRRIDLLDALSDEDEAGLSRLDNEYYEIEENPDHLLFEYIKKNADHFLEQN